MRRSATKMPGVQALVGNQRFLMGTFERMQHPQRSTPFGGARVLGDLTRHYKAFAVLHDAMAHEAQIGTSTRSFLEQPGLAIGAGAMGLVGMQQASEVTFGTFPTRTITSKYFTITGRMWFIVEAIDPFQLTVDP